MYKSGVLRVLGEFLFGFSQSNMNVKKDDICTNFIRRFQFDRSMRNRKIPGRIKQM